MSEFCKECIIEFTWKDEEKTEKTFKTINGERYSIPGDWVRVEADGSLTLLGRGSNCINTAGEKVFPEEVEEALKFHDDIADCLVVGIRFRNTTRYKYPKYNLIVSGH